MSQFLDLPVELLPFILRQIIKPHHLALCCLVNKTFSSFAIPQLYRTIYIYAWQKQGKFKVHRLFKTLSERPELAKWVKKLELRDFPKAYSSDSYDSLTSTCLRGLANCTALRSCTWTRDQTLSSGILETLSSRCPTLRELEINGHATGTYDPKLLLRFGSLTKVSLIMPSADVVDILPRWMDKTGKMLTAFHVLCKSSGLITDATLEGLALHMPLLKHFHIAGCPRVTHKGVAAMLSHNTSGLESLGLEGLSAGFDLEFLARNTHPLTSLTSLTLTLPPNSADELWSPAFLAVTAHSALAEIHLYLMGGHTTSESRCLITADFIKSFLALHAAHLRKFSVHRLRLQPEVVGTICASCPRLESLFVVVNDHALENLVTELARSHSLRNIHVNFPHTGSSGRLPPSEVLSIAYKLGPQVQQLGFANRVYQIDRVTRLNETGEVIVDLALAPYEHPEVPEQFLVVRT